MFETIKNAWKLPDLKKRICFTLLIIVVFRFGAALPVPFLDASVMQGFGDGNLLGFLNMLTGGAFQNATLFALSISPYITASIVVQLLAVAIPALEQMSKEGAEGRKRLNKISRYVTIALAVIQSYAYYRMLDSRGAVMDGGNTFGNVLICLTIVAMFTAGAMICVWLGEQIDDRGIGNGISMILFAGIVSRGSSVVVMMWQYLVLGYENLVAGATASGLRYLIGVPALVVIFVILIGFIVLMTKAERRIPIQYAKRVVGRKMYGGQSSYIPVNVNMSGVMPIIFASSLMAIPGTIAAFIQPEEGSFWASFLQIFNYNSGFYAFLYFILIIAFAYFYVAIQYNPVEMANNLRKNNGAIPGIRPGKPTSDFIGRIISKVTLLGAMFCAVVAILPIGIAALTNIQGVSLGGTTIIIIVGVALDTVKQLESEMMMRHYKGFLE
jgi:preprotein translocase subunit SecY